MIDLAVDLLERNINVPLMSVTRIVESATNIIYIEYSNTQEKVTQIYPINLIKYRQHKCIDRGLDEITPSKECTLFYFISEMVFFCSNRRNHREDVNKY